MLNDEVQDLERGAPLGLGKSNEFDDTLLAAQTGIGNDVVFARKVPVYRSGAQSRLPANIIDAGLVKTLPGETGLGLFHDLLPPGFQMGFGNFAHDDLFR